ncbi:MAG: RidA family protein [Microcella pacifica]|jgi:2-iminobutanoate/2-iminopropanoate deaminase|uniref:RidA family protein n=1 Tax=Microcella pacifica TaxID=2591847 RepID=UPI0033164743
MIEHVGDAEDKPMSVAVRAGDWLYVSGQASTDPSTGAFIPGTFDEEFARSISNLHRVIEQSGARPEQIVRVTSYVRDESSLPRYNELYGEAFAHPRPARTTIQMGFQFLQFEIDAILYLGS